MVTLDNMTTAFEHRFMTASTMTATGTNALPLPERLNPKRVTSTAIEVDQLDFAYGEKQALFDINLALPARRVTAFIGPSGCGKTTLLRCFNRMNDLVPTAKLTRGAIRIHSTDIHAPEVDPTLLRKRVGMVFQKSNPFPKSIYDNVAYGLRIQRERCSRGQLDDAVERALRSAALWDEVKDRLRDSGLALSGGQQQRLCIARALAVEPEVLLMDEPCAALDPIATAKIEELIAELKRRYTIVIVTHSMQQAARCSDKTCFFYMGRLVESGDTRQVFSKPTNPQTAAYISGHFG